MKFMMINRKIAILVVCVLICVSSIMYFRTLPEAYEVISFSPAHIDDRYVRKSPVLIIDAGHGGADGGAVSARGTIESGINLSIALKLNDICHILGCQTLLTRDSADIDYPESATTVKAKKSADQKARLALINGTENAVLISIHQNCYTSPKPFGAQVLFSPTDGSEDFGKAMQDLFLDHLNSKNRRTASLISKDIYLMNHIDCPAVLVECGFISNPTEEALLNSPEYQLKIAALIAACYVHNYNDLAEYSSGG